MKAEPSKSNLNKSTATNPNGKTPPPPNGNAPAPPNGNGGNPAKQWENIPHKQIQDLFQILTGNIFFPSRPFISDENQPDMIIRWRLPDLQKQKLKLRSEYKSINSFVSVPSPQLQRAFELAQKKIMYEMNRNKQNQQSTVVKFRYMQHLQPTPQPKYNKSKVKLTTGGQEDLQFLCFDQKNATLDGFTLYINSFIYLLQQKCGLKVRAFLVNSMVDDNQGILKFVDIIDQIGIDIGPKKAVKDLYLFLNLSTENMLKVASRFEIKKAVDYSNMDFHLNDPTTKDQRPIKFHSRYRHDKQRRDQFKNLTRYFKVRQHNDINTDILSESNLDVLEEQRFRSYWEESYQVFQFLKSRIGEDISNEEKIYLHEYNRRKINPGCEKILSSLKKRREYFELQKYIVEKYNYQALDEPELYEQFVLSNKKAKGGFFQKLRNILVYKPIFHTPYGDMALFNSMERAKLCYLMIKSTFKVNTLQSDLKMDLLALNNQFQKSGQGGKNQKVAGGLDGTFLKDRWYIFALFSDIRIIRNYYGDVIAHEIMIKISVVTYLFAICVPYGMLFILQALYQGTFSLVAAMIKAAIFVLSFSMFTLFIEEMEDYFVKMYSDSRHSKVFSNDYRGPYLRNILTDQLNEFEEQHGFSVFLRNFACMLIFLVLIVAFGGVFHGCRMFLRQIYDSLYSLQGQYFSMSHLIAYSIYLVVSQIFQSKLYHYIVKAMIVIKNPSSDIIERQLKSYFTFYYLLVIELIPIIFFFFVEAFSGTSCYSISCDVQFYFYIYARFLFNIIMTGIGFVRVLLILFRQAKKKIQNQLMDKQEQVNTFQHKLKKMMTSAINQAKRPPYEDGLTQDILSLFAYSFYCTMLPISGLIAFGIVVATYIIMRIELLYDNRRPINKSQPIIRFATYCKVIYFIGGVINIWVNTFLFGYIERHYLFIINVAPHPLTGQTIFLIKFAFTALFFAIITILGYIARVIAIVLSPKGLVHRQHFKYKQYLKLVAGPKKKQARIEVLTPLKNIFRTHNPEEMPHQLLAHKLDDIDIFKGQNMHNIQEQLTKLPQFKGFNQAQLSKVVQSVLEMNKSKIKQRNSTLNKSNQGQSKESLNQSSARLKTDKNI